MKTIFKTFLFAVALLIVVKTQAQSISYTVSKNDAYDIKNFTLAIDPFFVDVNGQNGYAFGWGFRADYLMGKMFQFNVDFRQGFGTKGYLISDNNTRNYSYKEAAAALTLSTRVRTKNLRIVLSQSSYSSGGYTYTTTTYIKGGVPGEVRNMIALRGGIYLMGNTMNYKNLKDSLLTFDDGNHPSFTFKDSAAIAIKQYGAVYSTAIFGGFNFKQIRQLILDVDGYGTRGNVMYRDFFIDAIFSPILFLKDYKVNAGASNEVKYNVKYGKTSAIGWRMGWFVRKPKDQGFSMKFEFGERPGYVAIDKKINNWYFMFTYGLYIPLKIKPIAERD